MIRLALALACSTLLLTGCTEQRTGAPAPSPSATTPTPAPAAAPATATATPTATRTKATAPAPAATPKPPPAAAGPTVAGMRLRLSAAETTLKRGGSVRFTLKVENTTGGDLQLPLPTGRCGLYAELTFSPALKSGGQAHTVKPGAYTGTVVTVPANGTATLRFTLARRADGALTVPNDQGPNGCGQWFQAGAESQVELRYRVYVSPGPNTWGNLTYTKPRWTGGELLSNPVAIALP